MSQNYPASSAATSYKEPTSLASSSWDGESCIQLALQKLTETLVSKNNDYKLGSEFSNFYFASSISDVLPQDVVMSQIGIKIGRIKGLLQKNGDDVNYESLLDSYQDLAGYAIILYALKLKETL